MLEQAVIGEISMCGGGGGSVVLHGHGHAGHLSAFSCPKDEVRAMDSLGLDQL